MRAQRQEILNFPDLFLEYALFPAQEPFFDSRNAQLDAGAESYIHLSRLVLGFQVIQMALKSRVLIHLSDQVMPAQGFEPGVGLVVLQDLPVGAFRAKIEPVQILHYVFKIVSGTHFCH